jgi:seryl-tRNA synthetase
MAVMTSLVSRSEGHAVSMTIQQWLQQGESLYQTAVKEFHAIEAQLQELETRLTAKLTEVNQIASLLGKSPVESARRSGGEMSTTQIVSSGPIEEVERHHPSPASANNIARALTGKFGR